ncbi:MAG: acyl-CoA thioesterase [Pseudomonadota bacterium]|nr:thioesterase family protein [Burkholderiales bacterium]
MNALCTETPLFVETHLGRVAPTECDHLGHMNVQFYVAKVSDAAWHVMASIGITPAFIRERRQAPAAVKQEIAYLKELRAGDLLRMDSGVLEASEKRLTFYHRLTNVETGQVAMTSKVYTVNMDLDARRSTPLDPTILTRALERLLPEAAP